ncbi:MAG TPA: RNA methyltransferase [Vicinamibacterales bacterium]|nr:RNA methyltransferase [Vicinamibacterales bacterium]
MTTITSRQNAIVSRYRAAARGERPDLLIDGVHLVRDAIDARLRLVEAAVRGDAAAGAEVAGLLEALRGRNVEIALVSPPVMQALSPVRSAAPIVAIARRPSHTEALVYAGPNPFVVIPVDVQDPGNVGAILRVAEAAGAAGAVCAGACADPYGWKALRGSMGSALRLPLLVEASPAAAIDAARLHGCRIVAAVPRGGRPPADLRAAGPVAILVGGEGAGLPPSIIDRADDCVTIPMAPPVESLNTAVAAAILLYEVRRQRTHA